MVWISFLLGAAVIIVAGIRLTEYADRLSEKTSIGQAWIGILLLGFVTSLPEAVTSLFSVLILGANDLAVGNLLGSNNFNPMLLVVMDVAYRKSTINSIMTPLRSHYYSSYFSVGLTLLIMAEIFLSGAGWMKGVFSVGWGSIFIMVIYFFGMKYLATADEVKPRAANESVITGDLSVSMKQIWVNIGVSAVFVVAGAIVLAQASDTIAEQTGLGQTFVGSILLALVTSLPEMVVSLSALRLGSVDLALGNIFGSNMTNIFILALCDVAYRQSSMYVGISKTHLCTAILGIILTGLAMAKARSASKRTILGVSRYSGLMIIVFVIGAYFLYTLR